MNRRDAFKLFVAGAVSLLGMKGLAETLRGPKMVRGISDIQTLGPVMGETAHWPQQLTPAYTHFVSRYPKVPSPSDEEMTRTIQRYRDRFIKRQCFVGEPFNPGVDIYIPDDTT